jgi:hypothetical protein
MKPCNITSRLLHGSLLVIKLKNRRKTDKTMAKRKGQKNKQRSTKHYTQKIKDRTTRNTLKTGSFNNRKEKSYLCEH